MVQFCKGVVKACGFDAPVYFNNPKFWTSAPSGHRRHAGPAAVKKPAAGSPKHASSASDDNDDDDDDDDGE